MSQRNTQPTPLQHHLKNASIPSSSKNYSRIQSELEREGFEVHKENLLLPSAAGKNKLWEAGGKVEFQTPCGLVTGPRQAPGKTGLRSLLPSDMGAMSHEQVAARPAQASSGFSAFHTLGVDAEARNKLKLSPKVFPLGCTTKFSCMAVPVSQQEQDCCSHQRITAAVVEVKQSLSNGGSLEGNFMNEAGDAKRPNYASVQEDRRPMQEHNISNYEQCCISNCVIDQNRTNADILSNVDNSDLGAKECQTEDEGWVGTSCETLIIAKLSKTCPAIELKPFSGAIHAHIPKAVLTFSCGEPSLPFLLEQPQQHLSSNTQKTPLYNGCYADDDWGKFLALSATPVGDSISIVNARVFPFQQRFKQLQAFLKQCDDTDQDNCLPVLRSLTAAARSGYAVELETRAIRLSLEEGQEMKRMRLLNVLGRMTDGSYVEFGATPQGPRLPAPGVISKFKSISQ